MNLKYIFLGIFAGLFTLVYQVHSSKYMQYTNIWIIKINGNRVDADRIADKEGFRVLDETKSTAIPGLYYFEHLNHPSKNANPSEFITLQLRANNEIRYAEQQIAALFNLKGLFIHDGLNIESPQTENHLPTFNGGQVYRPTFPLPEHGDESFLSKRQLVTEPEYEVLSEWSQEQQDDNLDDISNYSQWNSEGYFSASEESLERSGETHLQNIEDTPPQLSSTYVQSELEADLAKMGEENSVNFPETTTHLNTRSLQANKEPFDLSPRSHGSQIFLSQQQRLFENPQQTQQSSSNFPSAPVTNFSPAYSTSRPGMKQEYFGQDQIPSQIPKKFQTSANLVQSEPNEHYVVDDGFNNYAKIDTKSLLASTDSFGLTLKRREAQSFASKNKSQSVPEVSNSADTLLPAVKSWMAYNGQLSSQPKPFKKQGSSSFLTNQRQSQLENPQNAVLSIKSDDIKLQRRSVNFSDNNKNLPIEAQPATHPPTNAVPSKKEISPFYNDPQSLTDLEGAGGNPPVASKARLVAQGPSFSIPQPPSGSQRQFPTSTEIPTPIQSVDSSSITSEERFNNFKQFLDSN